MILIIPIVEIDGINHAPYGEAGGVEHDHFLGFGGLLHINRSLAIALLKMHGNSHGIAVIDHVVCGFDTLNLCVVQLNIDRNRHSGLNLSVLRIHDGNVKEPRHGDTLAALKGCSGLGEIGFIRDLRYLQRRPCGNLRGLAVPNGNLPSLPALIDVAGLDGLRHHDGIDGEAISSEGATFAFLFLSLFGRLCLFGRLLGLILLPFLDRSSIGGCWHLHGHFGLSRRRFALALHDLRRAFLIHVDNHSILLLFDLGNSDHNGDGQLRFDLRTVMPEADIHGVDALDLDKVLADRLFNFGDGLLVLDVGHGHGRVLGERAFGSGNADLHIISVALECLSRVNNLLLLLPLIREDAVHQRQLIPATIGNGDLGGLEAPDGRDEPVAVRFGDLKQRLIIVDGEGRLLLHLLLVLRLRLFYLGLFLRLFRFLLFWCHPCYQLI